MKVRKSQRVYDFQFNFIDNIAFLRDKKGYTLQQVADGIESSKGNVWELENGISMNPSIQTLMAFSRFYKVSPQYLLRDNKKKGE